MRNSNHKLGIELKSFFEEIYRVFPDTESISCGYHYDFGEWMFFLHTKKGDCYSLSDKNDHAEGLLNLAKSMSKKNNILYRKFEL